MILKSDFINRIQENCDGSLTKGAIEKCLNAMGPAITDIIKEQESVKIAGVVTLSGIMREAHTGRNPSTGESVEVPAKIAPKAKFSKTLKDAINS